MTSTLAINIYKSPEQTPELVRAIRSACSIILFSGLLPYRLAIAAGFDAENFDYIPFEGADLFRALAMVALREPHQQSATVPRIGFDSMTEREVAEAYKELGLPSNHRVIPLEVEGDLTGPNIHRIVQSHRELLSQGAIDISATCINAVFDALTEMKLPVMRLRHSRISIRQALERAQLLHELKQAEASQVAICLITSRRKAKRSAKDLLEAARIFADSIGGRILSSDSKEARLLSARGSIDRHLEFVSSLHSAKSDTTYVVGIGVAPNPDQAETYARQAQERALNSSGRILKIKRTSYVVETINPNESRERRQSDLNLARALKLSPAVVSRLGAAFRELDPNGFTATEFAQVYDIQPRSARRLLSLFKERGFVEERGSDVRQGAGRPQHIYRIFLDRLLLPKLNAQRR